MTRTKTHALRPRIDTLEDRSTPSVSVAVQNGDLRITALDGDNTVTVSNAVVNDTYYVRVLVENGPTTDIPMSQVTGQVIYTGNSGNDTFTNNGYVGFRPGDFVLTVADGKGGNDSLRGYAGYPMVLIGGDGADSLYGGAANDVLSDGGTDPSPNYLDGYAGNDQIYGGAGPDYMIGFIGNDTMYGYGGDDHMEGGHGIDYLFGQEGNDWMDAGGYYNGYGMDPNGNYAEGGAGNDSIYGGNGPDTLYGQNGSDWLVGNDGNDLLNDAGLDGTVNRLYGGNGNDSVYGGNARDYIYGEAGEDQLFGYDGDDYLDGGYGRDWLFGHNGWDTLVAGYDYSWNYLAAGDGNDYLYGGYGIDILVGEGGADYLSGNAGDDDLNGGDDGYQDSLYGGAGRDYFQQDYYYGYSWNVDYPRDWQSNYDSFYDW